MSIEKLKILISRFGGNTVQNIIICILKIMGLRNKIILFSLNKAEKNKVNINYWSGGPNLGDAISPIIVEYVANLKHIDIHKKIGVTKHLYAVGSVITAGCQDCTVWGSGILNTKIISRIKNRKLDIRSVRGPLTRLILQEYGYNTPDIYGDPAILMPMIYNPEVQKQFNVSVITHMNENEKIVNSDIHRINIMTKDYKKFIEEIKKSKLIVSSSLHGIIFAESYGVPAVLLRPRVDLFKYYDYYYSTQRYDFPIANSIEEALNIIPCEIPDFTQMQKNVLNAFPTDMWD